MIRYRDTHTLTHSQLLSFFQETSQRAASCFHRYLACSSLWGQLRKWPCRRIRCLSVCCRRVISTPAVRAWSPVLSLLQTESPYLIKRAQVDFSKSISLKFNCSVPAMPHFTPNTDFFLASLTRRYKNTSVKGKKKYSIVLFFNASCIMEPHALAVCLGILVGLFYSEHLFQHLRVAS